MKSFNHLFEKVIDYDNISIAIDNASLGKRNRHDVRRVLTHKHQYITKLSSILINNEFCIRKHEPKIIDDLSQHKQRKIVQPDFVFEQIVHHCVMQVLIPIFSKGMYRYSCGSIPKRGGSFGRKYIKRIMINDPINTKYVAKLDIKHFFENINHDILKNKLAKIIHDSKMLNLLYIIIDSYNDGLPLGYYTSQWFANFFLQSLDYYIKQELCILYYIRYMDDMVLFSSSKKELHLAIQSIQKYLKDSLGLTLKENYQVFRIANNKKDNARPLNFMGYLFYRDYTFLRKNIMLKSTRKIRKIVKKGKFTWYDASQLMAFYGWIKYTNTYNVFKKYWTNNHIYVQTLKNKISYHQKQVNDKKHRILN